MPKSEKFIKIDGKFVKHSPFLIKSFYLPKKYNKTIGQLPILFSGEVAIKKDNMVLSTFYHQPPQGNNEFAPNDKMMQKFVTWFCDQNEQHNFVQIEKTQQLLSDLTLLQGLQQDFRHTYGMFELCDNVVFLEDSEILQIHHMLSDPEKYAFELDAINQKTQTLVDDLNAMTKKMLFEVFQTPQKSIHSHSPAASPLDVQTLTIRLSKRQTEFLDKIKSLHATGITIENIAHSIEAQNASKNSQGYALYYNNLQYGHDGFLNNQGFLTANLLEARVFLTPEQALKHSQHKSRAQCVVIEVNFSFSKIMSYNDCTPGPKLNSLTSNRESSDLQDALSIPVPTQAESVTRKKNKL